MTTHMLSRAGAAVLTAQRACPRLGAAATSWRGYATEYKGNIDPKGEQVWDRTDPGPIPFSKTAAAQSIRDPIIGDHERNSKPGVVAAFVMMGVIICGTIIYVSVTGDVDSVTITNADSDSLARLLDSARERTEAAAAAGSGEAGNTQPK